MNSFVSSFAFQLAKEAVMFIYTAFLGFEWKPRVNVLLLQAVLGSNWLHVMKYYKKWSTICYITF